MKNKIKSQVIIGNVMQDCNVYEKSIGIQINKGSKIIQMNNKLIINGKSIPLPDGYNSFTNCSVINGKVYVDGLEWINGEWKKTLKAIWHKWF